MQTMLLCHTQHIKSIFDMSIEAYSISLILNFSTHGLRVPDDMKLQILKFYNEFGVIVANLSLLNL